MGDSLKTVGVRFKKACKIYTFDPGEVELHSGDWVVVETERGMALGEVAAAGTGEAEAGASLKRVLRRAEERDFLRFEQNCELEGYALQFCSELIRQKNLPMKLVDVEYLFDGSKAIFYFTAEGRVDFRELVRDLARQFHTRIEMRQIGVRDEAKLVGGVGCCGRELCCATWLSDFAPISVRMAKDQNVSLNPVKISGICGRLLCCLGYEHQMYEELAKDMPKMGKRVQTRFGEGKVVRRNVLEGTFAVFVEGKEHEISLSEYRGEASKAEVPAPEPASSAPVQAAPEQRQPAPSQGQSQAPSGPSSSRRRRRRRRPPGGQEKKTDG
ncbi:MAG: stage 0 sporulation family protein [Deltaproteobacteria bacterium]|nr:stage 0 sporulation family protein [Deltaproteobacteria bacterium]